MPFRHSVSRKYPIYMQDVRHLYEHYGERRYLIRVTLKFIQPLKNPSFAYRSGKASTSTPFRAGITIEAAFAVPFFFFAIISLIYLFEIMAIQTSVRSGLMYAGRIVAEESYPLAMVDPGDVEEYLVHAIGADRLERSIVTGGSSGMDCSDSGMSIRTGIGTLKAEYSLRIPVPFFTVDGITREESIRIKAWTGYEKEFLGSSEEEIVYVTETGIVYHRDYHCTYLDLSIHMVTADSVDGLRNVDGSKYRACRICGGSSSGQVYITDSGDKYHSSLSCSGLKRTVYAIPVSEAVGKGACVRCGP